MLLPGELIAFTRTVPNLPRQFSDEEWAEVCAGHTIHELGNVSNLSPDYASVMRKGLIAIRDSLTEGGEVAAGQVLGALGDGNLAEVSDPSHLHFAMKQDGKFIDPSEKLGIK